MIKRGLSRLGVWFLYLISLLPFWLLYLFSDVLYIILYYLIGYRKKVVQDNLANSFPDKSAAERLEIEKKYFRYLGDLIVETIKVLTISEAEIKKRVQPVNPGLIDEYLSQGRNIIGAVGHYGNWEMAALRFSLLTNKNRLIVYKEMSNEVTDELFFNVRSRFGAELVAMKDTLRQMVALKHELTFSVLVADQTPVQESSPYFTNFLNQQTPVFLGIEKLAKITDAVVVFCDVKCLRRGYYNYTFVPLTTAPKTTARHQITDKHAQYLEGMIRKEPQYWLWSHRRWKFKPKAAND